MQLAIELAGMFACAGFTGWGIASIIEWRNDYRELQEKNYRLRDELYALQPLPEGVILASKKEV